MTRLETPAEVRRDVSGWTLRVGDDAIDKYDRNWGGVGYVDRDPFVWWTGGVDSCGVIWGNGCGERESLYRLMKWPS